MSNILADTTRKGWLGKPVPIKQRQHRLSTRAPHGAPEFTERIAIYCTAKQKAKFEKRGGSAWLRKIIAEAA